MAFFLKKYKHPAPSTLPDTLVTSATRQSPKYKLRYHIEWGDDGTCLWADDDFTRDAFGGGFSFIEPERLPLSEATRERMAKLTAWYQTSLNWNYPPDPGPWRQEECDRFVAESRKVLEILAQELEEEFIIRIPENAFSLREDPDLDEYLKDPKNFRRKPRNAAH